MGRRKKIFKDIIAKDFSNLMRIVNYRSNKLNALQKQETQKEFQPKAKSNFLKLTIKRNLKAARVQWKKKIDTEEES